MSKILFHPMTALIFTVIAIILCTSFFVNSAEIQKSKGLVQELQEQTNTNQQEVNTLEKKLETAKDPLTKETIIRNELLMQKPGEYMVQMPDLPSPTPVVTSQSELKSPWEQWKTLFLY